MNLKPIELPARASSKKRRKLPSSAEKIPVGSPTGTLARTDKSGSTGTAPDTQ